MGTDFAKLKAPLVWYDILHVTEVLTQFPGCSEDKRLLEMLAVIEAKADAEGRFRAESVWKAWSDWDFGQKKSTLILDHLSGSKNTKREGRIEVGHKSGADFGFSFSKCSGKVRNKSQT